MQKNTQNRFMLVILLLLLFSVLPVVALSAPASNASPEDQVIQFVDPEVEFVIRAGLGIHDRDILMSDMETVQSFHNYVSAYEYDDDARDYDVKDLSDLAYCINLRELGLSNANVASLEPLRNHPALNNLWIVNCPNIQDLSPLSTIPTLTQVSLHQMPSLSLTDILSLPNLTYFSYIDTLTANTQPLDLSPLAQTNQLTHIQLNIPALDYTPLLGHDMQGVILYEIDRQQLPEMLAAWPNLSDFDIKTSNVRSEDLALFKKHSLQFLVLSNCEIDDLSALANQVEYLNLSGCPITDLSPLANQTGLESVVLDQCAVTDITPLQSITNLQSVSLLYNPVKDLSPLETLPYLSTLYISLDDIEDISQLQSIPLLDFFFFTPTEKYSLEDIEALLPNANVFHLTLEDGVYR